MKLPYMQFFTGDWLKDPALSFCSPATRGVWIDLICAMHETGQAGELRGTTDQLARVARCQPAELAHALTELQTTGAADVTERNGVVTVENRRMKRESKSREMTRLRVQRHRGSADVTPELRPIFRSQKSESEKNTSPNPSGKTVEAVEDSSAGLLMEEWNKLEGFPKCLALNESRRRHAKARMADPFFKANWRVMLKRITLSDFCKGQNDSAWKADFDWILQPNVCAKVLEGKYDNRMPAQPALPVQPVKKPIDIRDCL